MAKQYRRKQVGSLQELNREQERVKRLAGKMEVEWLDNILNPQQIALSLITSLLSRRKSERGKSSGLHLFSGGKKSKSKSKNDTKGKLQQVAGSVRDYAKKPAVTGLAKRIGISFLRWQAFNLAWFLGKKAYKTIRQKKVERQWQEKAEQLITHNK